MKHGCVPLSLLFACLIASVACVTYNTLTPGANPSGQLNPCAIDFYQIDVSDTDRSGASAALPNYLTITVTSDSDELVVKVTNQELTPSFLLDDTRPSQIFEGTSPPCQDTDCTSTIVVDVVCSFTSTPSWYIQVINEDQDSIVANYTIEATITPVPCNTLTVGTTYTRNYQTPLAKNSFATTFDFYYFTFSETSTKIGEYLNVTISGNTGGIGGIYINDGVLPAYGYNGNTCYDGESQSTTTLISYCNWNSIVQSGSDNFYISVPPVEDNLYYDILVQVINPEVTALYVNTASTTVFSLLPDEIQYFSFSSSEENQFINATIFNVQGGTVEFEIENGNLPYADCTGSPGTTCDSNISNCCNSVSNTCEIVIQPCKVQSGVYYIAVRALNVVSETIPLTYQIRVDAITVPGPITLRDSEFVSSTVSTAHYNYYEYSVGSGDENDATLDIHLYVDRTGSPSVETTLFINSNEVAGSDCWDNIASCTVSSVGSCTVQINPCQYADFDNWYITVYAGTTETEGIPTSYTVLAKLSPPVELDESYLVISSSVPDNQLQHYKLDSDMLPDGGRVTFVIFDTLGGDLNVYMNEGDLAGPLDTCPQCYNYTMTDSTTSGDIFTWVLANCAVDDDEYSDDIYFAVEGITDDDDTTVSYSLTIVAADDNDEASTDLHQNQVLVDSLQPNSFKNYTVNGDSSDSQAYLVVSLSIIDYATSIDDTISVTLYNTSSINCILDPSIYNVGCSTNDNGFCSFVVQACNFNTSDGWIAKVNNNNNNVVNYNLFYDIYSSSAEGLSNGEPYASSVAQNVYDQFVYSATGSDTLIVEVFFDDCLDIDGNACEGSLYASTYGAAGESDCFYDSIVQTDTEKCVFAYTSCDLPSENIYFSVTTKSELYPENPLRYTIKVTEKPYSVPIQLNTPFFYSAYPGQVVYHTFTYTVNPAAGSRIFIDIQNVENGEATAYLAQVAPPQADSNNCKCFEYGNELEVDYCDAVSGQWTVMVQLDGNVNQMVSYVITALSYSQNPTQLGLNTPISDSVKQYMYSYYVLPDIGANDQVVLSITNVAGGSIDVFYASDHPATAKCNSAPLQPPICNDITNDSPCLVQLGACIGSPKYISVYGSAADSYDPITYTIQISQTQPVELLQNVKSQSVMIQPEFVQFFSFDIGAPVNLTTSTIVNFDINDLSVNTTSTPFYSVVIYDTNTCGEPLLNSQENSNTTVSLSECVMNNLFFVAIQNRLTDSTLNLTITANSQDIAANPVYVAIGDASVVKTIPDGEWMTFYTSVANATRRKSLQYTITSSSGEFANYFGYGKATPDCNEHDDSEDDEDSYTVGACCVVDGDYFLAVEAFGETTVNVTFSMVELVTTDVIIENTNEPFVATLDPNETQEFKFTANPNSTYAALWVLVETNEGSTTTYLQQASVAGPSVGGGNCVSSMDSDSSDIYYYNNEQCVYQTLSYMTDTYQGGSFYIGVTNNAFTSDDVNVTISYGLTDFIPLNVGDSLNNQLIEPYMTYYYSFMANTTFTEEVYLNIVSDVNLYSELYIGNTCGIAIDNCNFVQNCTLSSTNICSVTDIEYIVKIVAPSSSVNYNITLDVNTIPNTVSINLDNAGEGDNQSGSVYASATVPTSSHYQNAQLILSNVTGNTNNIDISYTIVGGSTYCLSDSSSPVCSIDSSTDETTCIYYLDSCFLSQGTYLFFIDAPGSVDYNLDFIVQNQASTAIEFPTVVDGSVYPNERITYNVTIDSSMVSPGQSVSITLDSRCGSAMAYINEDYVAAPNCYIDSSDESFIFDACDIISGLNRDLMDTEISITVVGGNVDHESLNIPTFYTLELDIDGAPATFRTVGPNEAMTFGGQNIIYMLPFISGINDLNGELEIILNATNSASLSISYTEPTFCNVDETLTVGGGIYTDSIIITPCEVSNFDQLYISFTRGSDTSATFEVVHINPFVRNLNTYNENPQYGAVVPSDADDDEYTDEEYYSIQVDASVLGFQLTAWLENADDDINLLSGYGYVPTMCDSSNPNTQQVTKGGEIVYNWCDFVTNQTVYFTVNYPNDGNGLGSQAYGYELHYSISSGIDVTTLTLNQPLCDTVEANGVNYYVVQATYSPNTLITAEIYSITADGSSSDLRGYLTFGGLATSDCTSAEDTRDCSAGSVCSWSLECPFIGQSTRNISIAVESRNPNDASYYIVVKSTQITYTALTKNQPMSVESSAIETSKYYSWTLPQLSVESQVAVITILTEDDEDQLQVYMSENAIPGSDCETNQCTDAGSCLIELNSCTYTQNAVIYIQVNTLASYTITAKLIDIDSQQLPMNTFMEGSLTVDPESLIAYAGFHVQVTADMISNSQVGDMVVSVYGVNQGQLSAYITTFGPEQCVIDSNVVDPDTNVILGVSVCDFAVGDYYVSLSLRLDDQPDSCTPVTYGVMATYSTYTPETVALTSGTPYTQSYTNDNSFYYTYTGSNEVTSITIRDGDNLDAQLLFLMNDPNTRPLCAATLTPPVQYYWGTCSLLPDSFMIEVNSPTNDIILTDATFEIEVNSYAVSELSENPTLVTFTESFESRAFHKFLLDDDDSVQLEVNVTKGTQVVISIWEDSCTQPLLETVCYSGTCLIPFAWSTGVLRPSTDYYYVTVDGYGPTSYSIVVDIGDEETCVETGSTELCDITWPTWNYANGQQGVDARNAAAIKFYSQLAEAFCPPCSCDQLSSSCNSSLIEFTCTQTYRACGDNGIQTSVCQDTCADIEDNCGMTFEQAGLPMFSCNHNFYYAEDNEICTDTYGITVTDSSDIILYIVVIIVAFLIVLILAAVVAFVVFKKYKPMLHKGGYEAIENPEPEGTDDE